METAPDLPVRLAAFNWLREQSTIHGDVLPRALLAEGFVFDGHRVPLLGPQGIFKPAACELPLSITSLLGGGPYEDGFDKGRLKYAYRGTDPRHPDNVRLREVRRLQVPLVLFLRIAEGAYVWSFPVFVVDDHPEALRFDVQVDDPGQIEAGSRTAVAEDRAEIRREYVTSSFRRRLHQRAFRERVLEAYREQCALCHLRHTASSAPSAI